MTVKFILQYPDPRLRTRASDVVVFDDALQLLINDMFETMYISGGIGLAATQINVHLKVIVMDIPDGIGKRVLINPTWTPVTTELSELKEGCLSVPGYYDKLPRYENVMLRAQDSSGTFFEENASGLYALCIQHELDHLLGKFFIDDLSPLRRKRATEAMAKRKRAERKKL